MLKLNRQIDFSYCVDTMNLLILPQSKVVFCPAESDFFLIPVVFLLHIKHCALLAEFLT